MDDRTKRYTVIKNRLALVDPAIALLFLAAMQISGASFGIKHIATTLSSLRYGALAIYALLFSFIYYIATFYLNFYGGYIIEHRFDLSNQSLLNWIKDELKKGFLSLMLFIIFMEFLYFLLYNLTHWWFFMAVGWTLFTIVIVRLAPLFIIPLFFKYEPLGDDELKNRIMRLTKRCGIKILDVFKLNISKKTKKANAALVGMGKTRRVLLGDTLLGDYTQDEVEVVLAHELAHHKLAHMWKLILFGGLSTLAVFYLLSLSLPVLNVVLDIDAMSDISAFPSMMFVLIFISTLILPLQNAFSRKLESSADLLALRMTGLPDAFVSCMNKLAKQNLADPSPSRFIKIMLYDHPPISKRIEMAQKIKESEYGKKD